MQMTKFEEKAKEFLTENNLVSADIQGSMFQLVVDSVYKSKKLIFRTRDFSFEVGADNLEDLFDKAFRILKAYAPKATRERNKEEAPEQANLPGVEGE